MAPSSSSPQQPPRREADGGIVSKEEALERLLNWLVPVFRVEGGSTSTRRIAEEVTGGDVEKAVGMVKSLEARGYLETEASEVACCSCTAEGVDYGGEKGSPEMRVYLCVASGGRSKDVDGKKPEEDRLVGGDEKGGVEISVLESCIGAEVAAIGLKSALKNGWVVMDKGATAARRLLPSEASLRQPPVDIVQQQLRCLLGEQMNSEGGGAEDLLEEVEAARRLAALQGTTSEASKDGGVDAGRKVLLELKKRKLVQFKKQKAFVVRKGPSFSERLETQQADLTAEMLLSGSWRNAVFKDYNFFAAGRPAQRGSIHPLMQMMRRLKTVLALMGFEEMPTDQWVDSAFWCFDALFMPQHHPCRDIQDTFFLQSPASSISERMPSDYVEAVGQMHSIGGFGSTGWRYDWSKEEASKNVMRTHTTAVSARMLKKLADELAARPTQLPRRYFSIDRVFRNETLDATHLAEFHQVEGLVADRNITLGSLKGVMAAFYKLVGISPLRFKPAYNPYTEPSMEIFGFHTGLQKWIEVGNSGIFRPEMLLPMGLPPDVGVMAWGLSLERPTMISYSIQNIRELFGHRARLGRA